MTELYKYSVVSICKVQNKRNRGFPNTTFPNIEMGITGASCRNRNTDVELTLTRKNIVSHARIRPRSAIATLDVQE